MGISRARFPLSGSPGRKATPSDRRGRYASARRRRPPVWHGTRRRARPHSSIGRSLAPSPTASVAASGTPSSAASATSASRFASRSTSGVRTVPAIRPSAMSRRFATTRSKPREAAIVSAKTVKPPETSAVRTPAARDVATSAARARHYPDAPCRVFKHRYRQTFQQRDPFGERGGEIEFAVHRAPRDLGDLRAQADKIGQLVEHLVFDDRRFEIGDEHPLAPPLPRLHDDVDRGVADNVARGAFGRVGRDAAEREVARHSRREPVGFVAEIEARGRSRRRCRAAGRPHRGPPISVMIHATLPLLGCRSLANARSSQKDGARLG